MLLGTVKGTIVSTRKCESLVGYKLLLIEPYFGERTKIMVAADSLGAGIGELVLLTEGSSARFAIDRAVPIDAFVVGIVDSPPVFHT